MLWQGCSASLKPLITGIAGMVGEVAPRFVANDPGNHEVGVSR